MIRFAQISDLQISRQQRTGHILIYAVNLVPERHKECLHHQEGQVFIFHASSLDFFSFTGYQCSMCSVSQYHISLISTANDGILHQFLLPKILLDFSRPGKKYKSLGEAYKINPGSVG